MRLDIKAAILVCLVLIPARQGLGEGYFGGAGRMFKTLPTANIFPTPTAIVFPSLNIAAGVNPAGLTHEKGYAIQAAFTSPQDVFASIAKGGRKFAAGAGYVGNLGNSPQHGVFGGFAFGFEKASVGLSLRDYNLGSGGLSLDADLGTIITLENGLHFAGVLYHINTSSRPAVGVGFKSAKRFHFEVNALFPSLNNINNNIVATAVAGVYFGALGLYFRASYYTAWGGIGETVAVTYWFGKHFNVILQYTSPNSVTGGLTVTF